MKKHLLRIILCLFLAFSFAANADATILVRGATAITGGVSGSLDSLDGAALNNGDVCFVFYGTNFYFYKLNATSGLAESSPSIISPDTNAGTKRWILQGTTISDFAVGSDANGDMYYRAAGALTRLPKGTAGQLIQMNGGATAPEWTTYTTVATLPLGHISGLSLSHAADTDHDITVAAGKARDATDAVDQVLASAITKRFDAEFVVGSTNGGFAAGESLPASGTIHLWLIKRSDTGVVDVMANNHATTGLTPTLPANYDYKRRICSLRTDSSNNIINGDQWGTGVKRRFVLNAGILDIDVINPGTNAVTRTLSVPAGIVVVVTGVMSSNAYTYLSALVSDDVAPSTTVAALAQTVGPFEVLSNTSSQIRSRSITTGGAETVKIETRGWIDSL